MSVGYMFQSVPARPRRKSQYEVCAKTFADRNLRRHLRYTMHRQRWDGLGAANEHDVGALSKSTSDNARGCTFPHYLAARIQQWLPKLLSQAFHLQLLLEHA